MLGGHLLRLVLLYSFKVEDYVCVSSGSSSMYNVLLPVGIKAVATCALRTEESTANYSPYTACSLSRIIPGM